MSITLERLHEIAKECKAWDIIECWDQSALNEYNTLFGPVTEKDAYAICGFTAAVTNEELAAAEYFGGEG